MQFGLFSHIPWPEGTEQRRIIEDITEEVQYGEELGFLGPGSPSTTFPRYGLGASSLILLSSIAARTQTIRLGTAILVPPLPSHPAGRRHGHPRSGEQRSSGHWLWPRQCQL